MAAPVTNTDPSSAYMNDLSPPRVPEVPRDRREHAVDRIRHGRRTREQYEASGSVRHLRHAGLEARLAEQRRVLIAGDARYRDPAERSADAPSSPAVVPTVPQDGTTCGKVVRAAPRRARRARATSACRGCRRAASGSHWSHPWPGRRRPSRRSGSRRPRRRRWPGRGHSRSRGGRESSEISHAILVAVK